MTSPLNQVVGKTSEYTYTTKEFVHTHNHTVYSTLDGVALPSQYADECAKRGYPAMAATEHGNMASVPDMYTAFKKHGLKYIAGCEVYFSNHHQEWVAENEKGFNAQRANASDDPADHEKYLRLMRSRHLTVLAKNMTGFSNLVKLTTEAHRLGHHKQRGRSRIDFDLLSKFSEGLIVLSGCLNGPLSYALRERHARKISSEHKGKVTNRIRDEGDFLPRRVRIQNAINEIKRFKRVFKEDFYIELQMPVVKNTTGYKEGLMDWEVFQDSVMLADASRTPYLLANDCHYMERQDHFTQQLMMAIDQDVEVLSPDLFCSKTSEQYMKTRQDLWDTWNEYDYGRGMDSGVFHRACDNTLVLADTCSHLKIDDSPKTPKWGTDPDVALKDAVHRALKDRGLWDCRERYLVDGVRVTHREQAEIELERFISKGFSSYFLITADLVRYGREQGWPFSPRGSAGGSLVCMLLGIHVLNPLLFGLSFDRFMSASRGGYMLNARMPDPVAV